MTAKADYPMRSIMDKRYGYIYNAWSNGKKVFYNESQSGLTFKAMMKAAKTNDDINKRVEFFKYRVPEEFYDYSKDPNALNNLIDDPKDQDKIREMKEELLENMKKTDDPLYEKFKRFIEYNTVK